jgi:alanine racemase
VRPTRAEVNLSHLRHNLRVLRRSAAGARVFGVLKADAYGHGASAVARTLERAGIDGFCVAILEEAIELREAGIRAPVLVMGGYYGQSWSEVIARRLTPVIYEAEQAAQLAREVRFAGSAPLPIHLKIDTGMGRLGCPMSGLGAMLEDLRDHPELSVEGVMTHFACAESDDLESVREQLAKFEDALAQVRAFGFRPELCHAANSAAMLRCEASRLDLVRPGIALFGVAPKGAGLAKEALRPAIRVRTEIVSLREIEPGQAVGYGWTWRASRKSRIATLPMGYADGLSRHLSNVGSVLVRGTRAPIVGTVSMDLTMIDVTDAPGTALRDEVVVLGAQEGPLGKDAITADEVAEQTGTIPWDVLTSISRRVPRFYREP